MRTAIHTRTIPIDEFRRKLGELKKELPFTDFTLTDRGKPIARVTATPESSEVKKTRMMKMAGVWKETEMDDDNLWKEVLKKNSRRTDITL